VSAILKAMHAVMSEVGAIEKGRANLQQGYKFRGIDDVLEALQPLFVKHGIICTQTVLEHEREMLPTKSGSTMASVRLKVLHTYYAVADGTSVTSTTWGEAMDSGDKASNKAMAVALKYSHFFAFTIPTQDPELDTETASPEVMPQTGRVAEVPAAKPAQRTAASRPTVPPPPPGTRGPMPTTFPNYGSQKGAPLRGAKESDLMFYRGRAAQTLQDATRAQWHERERSLIEAIDLELSKQTRPPDEVPF
jgi:hypothetical protein